jgi:hypothetical protein
LLDDDQHTDQDSEMNNLDEEINETEEDEDDGN